MNHLKMTVTLENMCPRELSGPTAVTLTKYLEYKKRLLPVFTPFHQFFCLFLFRFAKNFETIKHSSRENNREYFEACWNLSEFFGFLHVKHCSVMTFGYLIAGNKQNNYQRLQWNMQSAYLKRLLMSCFLFWVSVSTNWQIYVMEDSLRDMRLEDVEESSEFPLI